MAGDDRKHPRANSALQKAGPQSSKGPPLLKPQQPNPDYVGSTDANTHTQFLDTRLRPGALNWMIGPLSGKGPPILRTQQPAEGWTPEQVASRDASWPQQQRKLQMGRTRGMPGGPLSNGPPILRMQQMGETADTRPGTEMSIQQQQLMRIGPKSFGPPVLVAQAQEFLIPPVVNIDLPAVAGLVEISGGGTAALRLAVPAVAGTAVIAGGVSILSQSLAASAGLIEISGGAATLIDSLTVVAGLAEVLGGTAVLTTSALQPVVTVNPIPGGIPDRMRARARDRRIREVLGL